MYDYLRNFQSVSKILEKNMEDLNRILKPPCLEFYDQMQQTLNPILWKQPDILRSFELTGRAPLHLIDDFQFSIQRLKDIEDQLTASAHLFANFNNIHQTWLEKNTPLLNSIEQLNTPLMNSLNIATQRMLATDRLLSGIDFEAFTWSSKIPGEAFLSFQNKFDCFQSSMNRLTDSIQTIPDLAILPAFTLPGAAREVLTTSIAVKSITTRVKKDKRKNIPEFELIKEIESETSVCINLLENIDPDLAKPYIGAHDALRGRNPDRARHILSSLREFWNHLLRRLAPDEHVLSWVSTEDKDLLHEGRPTRRARVLYICRSLSHEPLTDFVVQDTRALVKLLEFFNHVHELDPELTDEQLRALLLRTDSWVTYILQICEGTR